MGYDIFYILHNFFFFLSTEEGILFRASVEFVIFLLISYMIISEFLRERNTEHRYLSMAFVSLAIQRMITVFFYAQAVFGDLNLLSLEPVMPVVLNFLELLAIVLLSNAFVYPYKKNAKRFAASIETEAIGIFVMAVLIEILWILRLQVAPLERFIFFYGFVLFNTAKIVFLLYPVILILRFLRVSRYRYSIMTAFLVYAAVPILQIINFFAYRSYNPSLEVFLNPFPFIAVMLFTKVIYLKLVDKATLKDKLRESEARYKAAKELSEMKDSFISVVSHELRTPLTSMKLYTSLLAKGKFGKIVTKQKDALNVVSQETDRLSNLINDMLNLSKLESKKEKIKAEQFNFYDFAKSHHIYQLARERGITVKTSIPRNYTLNVDAEKFKLVFINLVGNAIKFTDKGGIISVTAGSDDKHWKISIRDTGIGIAQENIPKLFDKFFQIEDYMTKHRGGTGLGLAIAKKIVEMHNGDIKIESRIGKGSTFTVMLPKYVHSIIRSKFH